MGAFDFLKPIEEKKWIYVKIGFPVDEDRVEEGKERLGSYAETLGWELKVDKHKKSWKEKIGEAFREETKKSSQEKFWENKVEVFITPGEPFSPLEFKEEKRKLVAFAYDLNREMGKERLTGRPVLRKWKRGGETGYILSHQIGCLSISYSLEDRKKLENKDKELSKELFKKSLDELPEEMEGEFKEKI